MEGGRRRGGGFCINTEKSLQSESMIFKAFKLVSLNVTNEDFPITFYSLTFKDHNSGGMIVLKADNMAQNIL